MGFSLHLSQVVKLVAGLIAFSWCAVALPAMAADREWTVMVYMNGKNNLEPDALNNFVAMAAVGSTEQVSIVTELGRPLKHWTSDFEEWSGVYRFYVKQGANPVPKEALVDVGGIGEPTDMGKSETLSNFVAWAKKTYPARYYMLVIWNHGQGWRLQRAPITLAKGIKPMVGFTEDLQMGGFRAVSSDSDTGSILYNSEVSSVVSKNFVASRLDVLGFDACLMSMMETGYAFSSNADLMVSSEELEPGDGWQYTDLLSSLTAKPTMSASELGSAVVSTYGQHYGNSYLTTLSVIDLVKIRESAGKLSKLADGIRKAGPNEILNMANARKELKSYGASINPPLRTSVDLISLLERYQSKTKDQKLAAETGLLITDLRGLVLSNYASSRSANPTIGTPYGSQGLAIYYPETKAAFLDDSFHKGYLKKNTDHPVAFVQNETWPEFLYAALGIH